MKDTVNNLISLDKKEAGILISHSLKGLFPDKNFHVVMPPDRAGSWPHLNGLRRTKSVEITLEADNSQILVRAFDTSANPVTSLTGKTQISIPLTLDRLDSVRTNIQNALVDFQGFTTANTSTHLPLNF